MDWLTNNWQWVAAVVAVPILLALLNQSLNHYLASRRDRKKLAPQRPDAWLLHAVYYVLHRRWPPECDKPIFPLENTEYPKGFWEKVLRVCDEMRQEAFDGHLRVWGMPYRDSLSVSGELAESFFEPIPAAHWKTHRLPFPEALDIYPPHLLVTERDDGPMRDKRSMCALKVNRAEVESIWPKK